MLQKESRVIRSSNSPWLILKLFHIYRSGFKRQGNVSFIVLGSIRKRRFINPNKRRKQIAHKAFGCITTSVYQNVWYDGQYVRIKLNRVAALSQRIRRSRLKIKNVIFFSTKRTKYLKLAPRLI